MTGRFFGYVDTIKESQFYPDELRGGGYLPTFEPDGIHEFLLVGFGEWGLLQKELSRFFPLMQRCMDEYLKSQDRGATNSFFRVIFRYPALKWAYIFVDIGGDTIRFVPDETGTASDTGDSSFGKPDIGIRIGCEFSVLQAAGSCCYRE